CPVEHFRPTRTGIIPATTTSTSPGMRSRAIASLSGTGWRRTSSGRARIFLRSIRRGARVADYTQKEMMTVIASRMLSSDDVCFVGIGAPSAACNLARLTHAPGIALVYESGTIGTRPDALPLSIGDGELCETALTTCSVPEMFRYWVGGGRMTIGFL